MTNSIWLSFSNTTDFPRLNDDITVDIAIIGGGITGVTAAQLLSQQGLKVALLEKDRVGLSSTGNSTGNLYPVSEDILIEIRKKYGDGVMDMVTESRKAAVDLVEENVRRFSIDCDFQRVNMNIFSTTSQYVNVVEKSMDGASRLKLNARYSDLSEISFEVKKGMIIEGSAQFNPLRYVQGLARAIANNNCSIFENSEVVDIQEKSDFIMLKTRDNRNVKANFVIHATHSPKGFMPVQAELGPYREFGVAFKIKDTFPPGIYFGYFGEDYHTSMRIYKRKGEQFLILIGQPHKVGHGDSLEYLTRLEEFGLDNFEVLEVTHRWGAQAYRAPDSLPYIGAKKEDSRTYFATGFAAHGLTYGTVAAQLLSDLITGKDNPYAEIYRTTRFNPLKSAPKLIKENVDVFIQFVKDYVFKHNRISTDQVPPGEGRVIEQDGHKLAVYRTEHEGLQICSAVCTHLGCIVHWNNAERSWDCPCHGSRFSTSGDVIEGPALKALASISEIYEGKTIERPFVESTTCSDQRHVLSADELIDEEGAESFPASDPPGHRSITRDDRDQHRPVS